MAAFNKFNAFLEDVFEGVHDFSTDTFKVYLTNNAPNASTNAVKANLAEIGTGGGYVADGFTVTVSSSGLNGSQYEAVINDETPLFTATGTVNTWQYVVLYNSSTTAKTDPLIGWYDFGSAVDLTTDDVLNIDFASPTFTFA
jgi:hypothetical protein